MMAKLKLTTEQRSKQNETAEEKLRAKLLERLGEQLELAEAEQKGESVVKTRRIFVANEDGERVGKDIERRLRKWFWRSVGGTWFMELRYGGKALKLSGNRTAIEVGDKAKLTETIATLIEAVKAGELDKVLLAAKKERAAVMRRKR